MTNFATISEWIGDLEIYTWRHGSVVFKGRECIVTADGLGQRNGQSSHNYLGNARRESLRAALEKFEITHINPTNVETESLKCVRSALSYMDMNKEAGAFALVDCRSLPK